MSCRSGCPTPGTHASWGACLRASNVRIGQVDATAQKRGDNELEAYAAARKQGIQPRSTRIKHVRQALDASDATGEAFQA